MPTTVTGVGASKPLRSMRETEDWTVSTSSARPGARAAVKEAPATRAVAEPPSKSCFRRLFMLPRSGNVSRTRGANSFWLGHPGGAMWAIRAIQVNNVCSAAQNPGGAFTFQNWPILLGFHDGTAGTRFFPGPVMRGFDTL